MSKNVLKSLNNINVSINQNDQIAWECQAAVKNYNEAVRTLKEDCDRLKNEISNIHVEICTIEPQIKILGTSYQTQLELISLVQQSLINQHLYKNSLKERNKKLQEDANRIIDEHMQYIAITIKKLELTNPIYKHFKAEITKLKQSKIRCMVLQQRIIEEQNINKWKKKLKREIFYRYIIDFAQNKLNSEKYLKYVGAWKEESGKEREFMQKLAKAADLLKQKQMNIFLYNRNSKFAFAQLEFPVNGNNPMGITKAKIDESRNKNGFDEIQIMLQERDFASKSKEKVYDKLKFNSNNSKVRILENKTLKPAETNKTRIYKSKQERSQEIAAKIQEVVQNLNKSKSGNYYEKDELLPRKASQIYTKTNQTMEQSSIARDLRNPNHKKKLQNDSYEGSEVTETLRHLNCGDSQKHNINLSNSDVTKHPSQFSKNQLTFSKEDNAFCEFASNQRYHNNYKNPQTSEHLNFSQILSSATEPMKRTDFHMQSNIPQLESGFTMSGLHSIFSEKGNTNNNSTTLLDPTRNLPRSERVNDTSLEFQDFRMNATDSYQYPDIGPLNVSMNFSNYGGQD